MSGANTQYPPDFIRQFQDVLRRLDAIERTPPAAINLLGSNVNSAGLGTAFPLPNTSGSVSGTSVTFSLSRPGTVLVLGTASVSSGADSTSSQSSLAAVRIVGGASSAQLVPQLSSTVGLNTYVCGGTCMLVTLINDTASHTAEWWGHAPTSLQAGALFNPSLYVFLMGG